MQVSHLCPGAFRLTLLGRSRDHEQAARRAQTGRRPTPTRPSTVLSRTRLRPTRRVTATRRVHRGVRIGELLEQRGLVTAEQIDQAVEAQRGTGKRLGRMLVELGFVHERELADALAEQVGLEVVDLRHTELDVELAKQLPESPAPRAARGAGAQGRAPHRGCGRRPARARNHEPADPGHRDPGAPLRGRCHRHRPRDRPRRTGRRHAGRRGPDVRGALEARRGAVEQTASNVGSTTVDENAPIVQVVNMILEQARARPRLRRAHRAERRPCARARAHRRRAPRSDRRCPAEMGQSLVSRIKVMADMNIVERRRPQDGQFEINDRWPRRSTCVSPPRSTMFGEKCRAPFARQDPRALRRSSELGMPPETDERYYDADPLAVRHGDLRRPDRFAARPPRSTRRSPQINSDEHQRR